MAEENKIRIRELMSNRRRVRQRIQDREKMLKDAGNLPDLSNLPIGVKHMALEFIDRDSKYIDKVSTICTSDELVFRVARSGVCPIYAPIRSQKGCCELQTNGDTFTKNLRKMSLQATAVGKFDGIFEWAKYKMELDTIIDPYLGKDVYPEPGLYRDIQTLDLSDISVSDEILYISLINAANLDTMNIKYVVPLGSIFNKLSIEKYPKNGIVCVDAKKSPMYIPLNVVKVIYDYPVLDGVLQIGSGMSLRVKGQNLFMDENLIAFMCLNSILRYKNLAEWETRKLNKVEFSLTSDKYLTPIQLNSTSLPGKRIFREFSIQELINQLTDQDKTLLTLIGQETNFVDGNTHIVYRLSPSEYLNSGYYISPDVGVTIETIESDTSFSLNIIPRNGHDDISEHEEKRKEYNLYLKNELPTVDKFICEF